MTLAPIASRWLPAFNKKPLVRRTSIVDLGSSPCVWSFRGATQSIKYGTPANLPDINGGLQYCAISGDYLAVANIGPSPASCSIYDLSVDPPTRVTSISVPVSGAIITTLDFSEDGRYIAMGMNMSPYFAVFDRDNSWSKLSDPATVPGAQTGAAQFNKQVTRLLISENGAGAKVHVYSLSGGLTRVTTLPLVSNAANKCLKFSPDGTVLVAGYTSFATNGFDSWIVNSTGTGFTAQSHVAGSGIGIGNTLRAVDISPDNSLIALVSITSPYIALYNFPALTKATSPSTAPSALVDGVTFTEDGSEILLVGGFSPNIEGYDVATLTKFTRTLGIGSPGWDIHTSLGPDPVVTVTPGATTYNSGSGNYKVEPYNTLTIELWGGGASGGPHSAIGVVPAGISGNASTVSTYSLSAGGGQASASDSPSYPGGAGGTASGGNTTNTNGSAGGAANVNKLNTSTTSGAGGGGAGGGGAGGSATSVPIGSGTSNNYYTGNDGTAPGGGGSGGGAVIFSAPGGGNRNASGFQGGGGGAYVKHVLTFGSPGAPAVGDLIAYAVAAAATRPSGSGPGGQGAAGRIKFTVA